MRKVMCPVCIGLMVFSLGFAINPVFGSDDSVNNQAGWDKLSQLSPGQEIRVRQNDGKSIRGNFRSVTGEAIVLSMTSGDHTISRLSVHKISTKKGGHRKRNILIGAGIGAGAGLGGGAAYKGCPSGHCIVGPSHGQAIALGAGLGAILGAIVGAVIPSSGWHDIYRAR
jgi:hypothetical protein